MTKELLRKSYLEKRQEISPGQLSNFSELIAENLFKSFQFEGKMVSLFMPIERKKEINTYIILDKLLSFDASVCIPKANFESIELKHYRYESPEQLELSVFGIPEPKFGKVVQPSKIDVVLVPLICYDKQGHRLGYGKGFYDRFLKKCSSQTIFIGLSLFEPIDEIPDRESTDIPMHFCITPEGKIRF